MPKPYHTPKGERLEAESDFDLKQIDLAIQEALDDLEH